MSSGPLVLVDNTFMSPFYSSPSSARCRYCRPQPYEIHKWPFWRCHGHCHPRTPGIPSAYDTPDTTFCMGATRCCSRRLSSKARMLRTSFTRGLLPTHATSSHRGPFRRTLRPGGSRTQPRRYFPYGGMISFCPHPHRRACRAWNW